MANLHAVRWSVRAVLALGVAASVTANILHAQPNPISQTIAAWPPCALLLTVELISRVPVHRRALAAARLVATAVIAGIAAWVSYWHMVGVAAKYGESDRAAAYLLPLTVDGLVVVASICLVELAGRISEAERTAPVVQSAPSVQSPSVDEAATETPAAPPSSRPHHTPVRRSRPLRRATLADVAAELADWTDGEPTRDKLAAALRAKNLSIGNKRAGDMLDELLPSTPAAASVRELVPA